MAEAPNAPRNLDVTTQQLADRVASAISHFAAATAYRMTQSPLAREISDDEAEAYDEMRAALHDMATTEYDRGYRRAVALYANRRVEGPGE